MTLENAENSDINPASTKSAADSTLLKKDSLSKEDLLYIAAYKGKIKKFKSREYKKIYLGPDSFQKLFVGEKKYPAQQYSYKHAGQVRSDAFGNNYAYNSLTLQTVHSIPIMLSEKQLWDHVKSVPSSSVSKRTKSQIRKAIHEILSIIKPQGIYRILPINQNGEGNTVDVYYNFSSKKIKSILRQCNKFVVFLATLGPDIDQRINKAMKKRPHYGYILNTVAAAAAEEAADYLQKIIHSRLPDYESTTYRYSPGYCDWHLREQRKLVEIIPYESIGVQLTKTCLMTPSKSVSGVFGVCSSNLNAEEKNYCLQCKNSNCQHRRK